MVASAHTGSPGAWGGERSLGGSTWLLKGSPKEVSVQEQCREDAEWLPAGRRTQAGIAMGTDQVQSPVSD